MNGTVVNIIDYHAVDPGSIPDPSDFLFLFFLFLFLFLFFLFLFFVLFFLFRIFNLFLFSFFLSTVKGVIILFH